MSSQDNYFDQVLQSVQVSEKLKNAESKPVFIHKFKISAKEAEETEYWLLICKSSKGYPDTDILMEKLKSIQKIINRIIVSSKQ